MPEVVMDAATEQRIIDLVCETRDVLQSTQLFFRRVIAGERHFTPAELSEVRSASHRLRELAQDPLQPEEMRAAVLQRLQSLASWVDVRSRRDRRRKR